MVHAQTNTWGLPISAYPKLYTQGAINAHLKIPLESIEDPDWRSLAIQTISDICEFDHLPRRQFGSAAAHITLPMLKSVLELIRSPSEFENFALPSLVGGSIVLMSTVEPTPFSCEFGYLCFRMMVFSLNACLIKHGHTLEYTIERMGTAPPGTHLSFFWGAATELILGEIQIPGMVGEKRLTHTLNPGPLQLPPLERSKLHMLLRLLHEDQKHFLIVLMTANSLQLSGVMFVLWKYLESEKMTRSATNYFQKLFLPFSRILRRYRLVYPDHDQEAEATGLLYVSLPDICGLQDKAIVDVEDSRNIIHAYNHRFKSSQLLLCNDASHYMGFVSSMFTTGCEDLVPDLLKSTFSLLWKNAPRAEIDELATVVQAYGVYFWSLFYEQLKLPPSNPEPWRYKLVDAIIQSDILELVFRVAWRLSGSSMSVSIMYRIEDFLDSVVGFWEKALEYGPRKYVQQQMMESGTIDTWLRYFTDFRERMDDSMQSSGEEIIHPFSMVFSRAMVAVLGQKWRTTFGSRVTRRCRYPRCPSPTKSSTGCANCMKATYCSARCLGKDWQRHARVCRGSDSDEDARN